MLCFSGFFLNCDSGVYNYSTPPVTPDLCQDGVVRIDLPESEQTANGPVALKISGFDGVDCNTLEEPLAAVNWYIYPTNQADIDSLAAYQAGMVPILRSYGTRLLFGNVRLNH